MGTTEQAGPEPQKRCFVVMGFGKKTDLATGRKLDLDKSYQALIKPAVEKKGIICVRADEIKHSGSIDVPMYRELFTADIVIADLSTANLNAFYELGVRHALRPRTTILMSESKLTFPFDINHVTINTYTHLGDSIDYFEVIRFQKVLEDTIDAVLNSNEPDSPVYTFLDDLIPPALKVRAEEVAKEVTKELTSSEAKQAPAEEDDSLTLASIVKKAENALNKKEFKKAKAFFAAAMTESDGDSEQNLSSNNTYLTQRLALATYKAQLPDEVTALQDAMKLLKQIDLDHTNDSETVALAGAIEKKLYLNGQGDDHLDSAVVCFQRGFFLLHNRYNGINLAFLFNCRVDSSLDPTDDDKIADLIWANRVRKDVLRLCDRDWNAIINRQNIAAASPAISSNIANDQDESDAAQQFWIWANRAEAHFGLGDMDAYHKDVEQATALKHEDWMMETFNKQLKYLEGLLKKHGHLLTPAWQG